MIDSLILIFIEIFILGLLVKRSVFCICLYLQAAHEAMLQYGSTDLQALLNITGEGGAWNNHVLVSLLTGQPTDPDEGE